MTRKMSRKMHGRCQETEYVAEDATDTGYATEAVAEDTAWWLRRVSRKRCHGRFLAEDTTEDTVLYCVAPKHAEHPKVALKVQSR